MPEGQADLFSAVVQAPGRIGKLTGNSNSIPGIVQKKHYEVRITRSYIKILHILVLFVILPTVNVAAFELPVFLEFPGKAGGPSEVSAIKLSV